MTTEPTPSEKKPGLVERFPALERLMAQARARRVPEVRQLMATDCGAACLAMVLGYHGRPTTLEEMREQLGPGRDGVTARMLMDAARRKGLRGRALSIDLPRLPYLPPASVLHWDFNHYVVFERLTRNGVDIVDPGRGRRRVPIEQLSQHFTGVALLLEPAQELERPPPGQEKGAFRYLLPLMKPSDSLGRIVLLSALLQVFALAVPLLTGMVVDRVIPRGDYHLLRVLSVALTALMGFQLLTSLIRGHLLLELRIRLDSRMTLGFLDHLVELAYSFFQLRPAGDLMVRMNIQSSVRELLSSTAVSTLLDGGMVLLYLAVLMASSAWMGLLVLGLGLAQVLVFLVTRERRRSLLSRSIALDAQNQNYQMGMLAGMQTLKSLGAEQRAVESYSHLFVDALNVLLRRERLTLWVDALIGMLRLASPLLLLSVGASMVLEGQLTLGRMLAINALAGSLLTPLSNLISTAGQFQLLGTYLERLNDVLDTPPEQPRERRALALTLQGTVELERIRFRYGPDAPWVIQDVSLRVQPGQMVALVGRSGAGKTTLAHLLLGLYRPTDGQVSYDGVPLRELDLRHLRSQVGIVLQEAAFFSASIRDNIALGLEDAPLERIVEAAKKAQVHDDIMAMPMQYETLLVDRGLSLSGGQRQRLALARALVRRPVLLLLDEATSSLDAITERQVQDSLARLQCTRIVIAHRLSTIRSADLIVVMEGGRVVESGNHEELLAREGVYTRLVRAQLEQAAPLSAAM